MEKTINYSIKQEHLENKFEITAKGKIDELNHAWMSSGNLQSLDTNTGGAHRGDRVYPSAKEQIGNKEEK